MSPSSSSMDNRNDRRRPAEIRISPPEENESRSGRELSLETEQGWSRERQTSRCITRLEERTAERLWLLGLGDRTEQIMRMKNEVSVSGITVLIHY